MLASCIGQTVVMKDETLHFAALTVIEVKENIWTQARFDDVVHNSCKQCLQFKCTMFSQASLLLKMCMNFSLNFFLCTAKSWALTTFHIWLFSCVSCKLLFFHASCIQFLSAVVCRFKSHVGSWTNASVLQFTNALCFLLKKMHMLLGASRATWFCWTWAKNQKCHWHKINCRPALKS